MLNSDRFPSFKIEGETLATPFDKIIASHKMQTFTAASLKVPLVPLWGINDE